MLILFGLGVAVTSCDKYWIGVRCRLVQFHHDVLLLAAR